MRSHLTIAERALAPALASLCLAVMTAMAGCEAERPAENYHAGRRQPKAGPGSPDLGAGGSTAPAPGVGGIVAGSAGTMAQGGAVGSAAESPCGPPPLTMASGAFSREALRRAAASCATWHYCEFAAAASGLESAVSHYRDDPSTEHLTTARRAWRRAMETWSEAELFQFGPAASASEGAGKDIYQGQGLRNLIHAWPATARCRVEEQIVERGYAEHGMDSVLVSGRGLFAVEYGLFATTQDTDCATSSRTAELWADLDEAELRARRIDYAVAVSRDLRELGESLHAAWQPSGGDFTSTFVSANGYPSEQEALNVLAWAMMYVEKEIKDWKLGIPAGYTLTAPVSGPETPFAGTGTENLEANLRGFQDLFQGCGADGQGLGFDDWLEAAGHGALASDIVAATGSARRALASLPPLHEASKAELEEAYTAVKALTDLLKNELLGAGSPLNLKLPATVEGDTD